MKKSNKEETSVPVDVQALLNLYDFQDFQYIDTSKSERLSRMLEKWPLIAEIKALTKKS